MSYYPNLQRSKVNLIIYFKIFLRGIFSTKLVSEFAILAQNWLKNLPAAVFFFFFFILFSIVGESAGGGSMAVAVAVSNM